MRSFMVLVLLVFFGLSGVSAQPGESLSEQLQSEELRQVFSESSSEDLEQLIVSAEARENMLQQALFYAGRGEPIDNRAYLFALAIDLYHSLPPGLDPSGYEPGELGGKGEWMRRFRNWPGWGDFRSIEMPLETDRDGDWETLIREHEGEGQFDNLVAAIEIKYIRHYFQEHVQLDDFIQHASLDVEDLSYSNPTHYAALRAYLDAMQHRIRSGVPPWESPESDEPDDDREAVPMTSGSPLMSVPRTEADEFVAPLETPVPEKASGMSTLMKLAIGVLLIVAIVVLLIRRERRG